MDADSDNDAGFEVGRRHASPYVFQRSQIIRLFTPVTVCFVVTRSSSRDSSPVAVSLTLRPFVPVRCS